MPFRLTRYTHHPAEAARDALELADIVSANPPNLYDAACALSHCIPISDDQSLKSMLSDKSIEMLCKAVAAGWKDPAMTELDPDLFPLNNCSDFRDIVHRLWDGGFPVDQFLKSAADSHPVDSRN